MIHYDECPYRRNPISTRDIFFLLEKIQEIGQKRNYQLDDQAREILAMQFMKLSEIILSAPNSAIVKKLAPEDTRESV